MRVVLSTEKDSTNSLKIAFNVTLRHLGMKVPTLEISDCTDSVAKENVTLHRRISCGECISTSNRQLKKTSRRLQKLPQRESRWRFAIFWKSRRLLPCPCKKLSPTPPYLAVLAHRQCRWERSLLRLIARWPSP